MGEKGEKGEKADFAIGEERRKGKKAAKGKAAQLETKKKEKMRRLIATKDTPEEASRFAHKRSK